MLLKLFLLTILLGLAGAVCPDSSDLDVKGACFKFVAQQMTFKDARNWCHYQNPVGSSYLAYVSDSVTSNNLASHARVAFGPAAQNFWIGLSRNSSSGSLSWDNGLPVIYTNFGKNIGKSYFGEQVSNGKWNTLGDDDKNFFVCSYDPAGNPSTTPATNCLPGGQQTVLLAYSNDLNPSVVTDTLMNSNLDSQPVNFAISRFDMRKAEEIRYFSNYSQIATYVSTNLPDPLLGFGDTRKGSDVLDVIDKFYDNTQVSPCGSIVMILLKRYPNTTDISNIVAKVRKFHGIVNFLASNAPSGGTQSTVLYDLSSRTNGLYAIEKDDTFSHFIEWMPLQERYPIHASNPRVSGKGSQTLPPMYVPFENEYLLMVALQNHVPVSNVQSVTVSWYNDASYRSGNFLMQPAGWTYTNSNDDGTREHLEEYVYNVTIDYDYTNSNVETMQVRFYSPL